jgi:hypothetical protein
MEDFMSIILSFIAILVVIFGGLIIYTLSLFLDFKIALSLVLAVFSLIIGLVIYFFAPSFDNDEAIKVTKQLIMLIFIANILLISGNLFKAFAIF